MSKLHLRSTLLIGLALSLCANAQGPEQPADGQLSERAGRVLAWSADRSDWIAPEAFWLDYARANTLGKFWGRRADYPAYKEVSEHDTLLIELDAGPCLMYFYHERWRRAQDVRRWDPGFNDLLGCPHVFD